MTNEPSCILYPTLVQQFNVATDFGGQVPRGFGYDLLEQIRLRDKLISDFRTLLISWQMYPHQFPTMKQEDYTRWEREFRMVMHAAQEVLEGEDPAP